jgi:hypothetical protein
MNNNQFLFKTDNLSINSSSLEDITLSTTEEEDKLPNTLKLKKIKKSKNNIETNNENNISSLTNQYKLHQPSGTTCISRTDYKTFILKKKQMMILKKKVMMILKKKVMMILKKKQMMIIQMD